MSRTKPTTHPPCETLTVDSVFPNGVHLERLLGKGSNNKVFRIQHDGRRLCLRIPRRRSDTQQMESAVWESWYANRAHELGIGPAIHRCWRVRHATDEWNSGLYMLMEHFAYDLEDLMYKERDLFATHREEIGRQLVSILETMANDKLLHYDLKATNVVVKFENNVPAVRLIDFGNDFCEHGSPEARAFPASHAPTIDYLERLVAQHDDRDAYAKHVLFVLMMVQLSATMHEHLRSDRHKHRMGAAQREEMNVLAPHCEALLKGVRGDTLNIVGHLMRTDEIKGVLKHYMGRRNAGTKRTFRAAGRVSDC